MSLRLEDLCLLFSIGYINVGEHLSLRGKNTGSLSSLSLSLKHHRFLNGSWWLNIFDLISDWVNSPSLWFLLNSADNFFIECFSLLEQTVQGSLTDFRPHRCLCKICDCILVRFYTIWSFFWIYNLNIEHSVDMKGHVIPCHRNLWGDLNCLFSQIVYIFYGVNEW